MPKVYILILSADLVCPSPTFVTLPSPKKIRECSYFNIQQVDSLGENIKRNAIGRVIEKESLHFPPEEAGTKSQYHAVTRGYILNEIYRRVDPAGRTIGECLSEEISKPLGK